MEAWPQRKFVNQQIMGVVNVTPDSFSDGGQYCGLSSFAAHCRHLIQSGATILDIGAESTAPQNQKITAALEWERLERTLLSFWHKEGCFLPEQLILSIDTYRPQTFLKVYQEIKRIDPKRTLWFNDVSGCFDDEVKEVLEKSADEAHYVWTHNLVRHREETSLHKNFAQDHDGDMVAELLHFFSARHPSWRQRLIFDPGFGFAKTRQQNWQLVHRLGELLLALGPEQRWLLGLSKKSFLRPLHDQSAEAFAQAEEKQKKLIEHWCQTYPQHHLIFRLHHPSMLALTVGRQRLFEQPRP